MNLHNVVLLILLCFAGLIRCDDTVDIKSQEVCRPVEIEEKLRCTHVKENCDLESQFNYLQMIYCDFDSSNRYIGVFSIILLILLLFVFLGTAASDYFCPNLATISRIMGLSDNVAGVTLLAVGNSAPDIFSSIIAFQAGTGAIGMAMGEMVGSGLFLGGAVFAGIIFFAKDINTDGYIKLERNVFLRDSFFMLFSTLILLSLAITKHIYWWDGVLMLFLYLLYIVIVVFMGKSNTNSNDSQDTLVRNDFTLPRSLSDQPIFSNASDNIIISDSISERIKSNRPASIYSFRSFDNNFNSRRLYNLQSKLKRARYLIPSFPEAIKLWDQWNSLKNDISSDSTANDDSRIRRHAASISCRICHLAISNNNESRKQSASNYFKNRFIPKSFRNFVAILNCIYDVDFGLFYLAYFHHLFPIFDTFRNSSLFGKLTSVINMPAVFVLGMTVPVVFENSESETFTEDEVFLIDSEDRTSKICRCNEPETDATTPLLTSQSPLLNSEIMNASVQEINKSHRWILILQSFFGTIFCFFAFGIVNFKFGYGFNGWHLSVIISFAFAMFVMVVTHSKFSKKLRKSNRILSYDTFKTETQLNMDVNYQPFAFTGFLFGVAWIYLSANELVGLIQSIGIILDLDQTLLGITVLAFGNSVGDLVCNLTLAQMGLYKMSLSAIFAGPLMNTFIPLSFCGIYNSITGRDGGLPESSTALFFTLVGLIIMVVVNLILIPLKKFRVGKYYGIALLVWYVLVVSSAISLEMLHK